MAAAIYNKVTGTSDADSVGTYVGAPGEPEGLVISQAMKTPYFFEVMESHGMNIRSNTSKKLQPEMLDQYDIVVSMAEEPFIPLFLSGNKKVIWWEVENPNGMTREIAEETYQKVNVLVQELIKEITS